MTDKQTEINIHQQLGNFYSSIAGRAYLRDWRFDYSHDPQVDAAVTDFKKRGRYIVARVVFRPDNVEALSALIDSMQDLAIGGIESARSRVELVDAVDRATPNLDDFLVEHNHLPDYEPGQLLSLHTLQLIKRGA